MAGTRRWGWGGALSPARRSTPSGERSAEQRAQAAAERAARRAAREGEGGAGEIPPAQTFGARAASSEVAAPVEPPPPVEREAVAPVYVEPEPSVEREVVAPVYVEPEPSVEREVVAPEPAQARVEPEVAAPVRTEPPVEREVVAPVPVEAEAPVEREVVAPVTEEEPPAPPARAVPGRSATRPAAAPPRTRWRQERGVQTLAPTRPRATAGDGRARRRILAVLALGLIGLALYVINQTFQPLHGDGRGAVRVSVPAGAGAGKVGDILAERGVVADPRFFSLNATLTRRRGELRTGDYTLPRDLSNGAAIEALIRGPKIKAIQTFNLSIPEGRSVRETSARLGDAVDGDYVAAARSPARLRRARRLGLPRAAKTLEGYLFPATYELPRGTTAGELVDRQLDGFADNTAKLSYARAKRRELSRYDVLIIASMIEREVELDRERRLVSAVIYNRLRQGIPLGIDATIRYATSNWTRPIRVSELERDGPYNSRTRRGLPPTPIGNPGLASIRAATRPAPVDYLYYVVKPGSEGAHAFSSSDAQFQRDVARYQQAREASGQAP